MGFMDLFKGKSQTQIAAPVSKKSFFASIANQFYGSTDNYQGLAQEGYAKNPYMYACVDQRASNLAALPLQVISGERVIETAPVLDLFKNAIYNNENISLYDFFYFTSAFLDLAGEVFFWGDNKESPAEIILLNPSDVEIRTIGGTVEYYIGKKQVDKENEFFLCIKSFNPIERYQGLAPASAAALSLDTNNAGRKYNASLLQKHTKVSAILKGNAGEIPAEMREQFRNDFKAKVGGPTNAGDVLFMSGDIDYVEGQMKPVDMDWTNAMDLSGREIAMAFKVPLELLGVGKATYENVKEAKLGFMQQTVIPQMQRILIAFEKALLPENEHLEIDLNQVEVIQKFRQEAKHQELTAKSDFSTKLYGAGIITQNEAREALGLEGISGGDIVKPSMPMIMSSDMRSLKALDALGDMRKRTFRLREQESMRMFNKLTRQFRVEKKNTLALLEDSRGDLGLFKSLVLRSAADRVEALQEVLDNSKIKIVERVGLSQLRDLQKAFDIRKEKQMDEFDVFKDAVTDWVTNDTAKKVVGINKTTEKQISKVVQNGIDDGLSITDIADGIDDLYLEQIIPNRSMVIARTETIPAINFGVVEAGKQSGIPLAKVWLSTPDERTRISHSEMEGVSVGMDEPFTIDADALNFPADSSLGASAENVIQCRCTIGYKEI